MLFAIVGTGLIITWIVIDYCKKIRLNRVLHSYGVKGPLHTLPLIGDALLVIGLNIKNVFEFLMNLQLKYGKIYRLWSLNKCIIIVQDVTYAEDILSSQRLINKSFFYDLLACWLGNGLLLSTGSKWHKRRKIITPTFHFKILEQFTEIFDQQARLMIEKLRPMANGEEVIDIFPMVCSTALDIIVETAMGVKINSESPAGVSYAEALKTVAQIVTTRCLKPMQYFDFTFKLTAYRTYNKLRQNIRIMHEFTKTLIDKRRTELLKEKMDDKVPHCNNLNHKQRITFLDVLLQSTVDGLPLSNEDIREEVDTFTFEGHDTTTSAISHILYLIARHPKVQQKVFEEILQIIGNDKNKIASLKELQELKYLECVIKEGLRLYPAVPVISRKTAEDYKIGYKFLPRNTTVILLIYAICRDPEYFTQPNDFIPERFSCSNTAEKINPYAYVPFSAGPRNCIGQKFAILEMKSLISCMLRHYVLLPLGPEVVSVISLVMRSTTGVNIGLKPRQY